MKLMLVRHGDAASGAAYADDALRPLTEKGRTNQTIVARCLKVLGEEPDLILSSPRLRARQTAEIVADVMGLRVQTLETLDGGYPVEDLCARLAGYPQAMTIMCVGHEPDMSLWTGGLICQRIATVPAVQFRKSAVLGLEFDGPVEPGNARLLYYWRAADFKRLGCGE